jgi:3'5'-cyclic nucleotide phosphodiesterase
MGSHASLAFHPLDNPFHNFEHASHVTMSVTKLLTRIVTPSEFGTTHTGQESLASKSVPGTVAEHTAAALHDHSFGLWSDPLAQFACIFSAIIHDVDHPGVSNQRLVVENPLLASRYSGKSVAEKNSVDVAWSLLMKDDFRDLRNAIAATPDELTRFRQLVVNLVMATDIMDNDLKTLRNARWDKAFAAAEGSLQDQTDRKATIVIEHMIQASDVAHTMQHFQVYRKWNERLFQEMYVAFIHGRCDVDPSLNWYKGEIGFFDFYVIPLAKKLKDCGVFGVSSSEYLDYALKNRREWEERGEIIVAEMLEKALA